MILMPPPEGGCRGSLQPLRMPTASGVLLTLSFACTSPDASTQPRSGPVDPVQVAVDVRAEFHRRNPQDWVGVTHNKALDAYFAYLRRVGFKPGETCGTVVRFKIPDGSIPERARRQTREQLRTAVRQTLERQGHCRPGKAGAGRAASFGASLGRRRLTSAVSAEAESLLVSIVVATDTASNTTTLSSALTAIMTDAEALDSVEEAAVDAAASVAQSSREYWEENLASATAFVSGNVAAYCDNMSGAGCLGTLDDSGGCSPPDCYETRSPGGAIPNRNREMILRLASSNSYCPTEINDQEIAHADVIGFVAGVVAGAWTGPGALATGATAAFAGSLAEFVWQVIVIIFCQFAWPI